MCRMWATSVVHVGNRLFCSCGVSGWGVLFVVVLVGWWMMGVGRAGCVHFLSLVSLCPFSSHTVYCWSFAVQEDIQVPHYDQPVGEGGAVLHSPAPGLQGRFHSKASSSDWSLGPLLQ